MPTIGLKTCLRGERRNSRELLENNCRRKKQQPAIFLRCNLRRCRLARLSTFTPISRSREPIGITAVEDTLTYNQNRPRRVEDVHAVSDLLLSFKLAKTTKKHRERGNS